MSSRVEGETILLDLSSGLYFGLDATGSRIWEALQEGPTLDELVQDLRQEYEVDSDRLRREVSTLLEELQDHGLVEVRK